MLFYFCRNMLPSLATELKETRKATAPSIQFKATPRPPIYMIWTAESGAADNWLVRASISWDWSRFNPV